MKPIKNWNGALTSYFHKAGLDSVKVLDAVNAWVGQVNHDADKTEVKSTAKLTGKLTEKKDGRVVTIRDTEKYVAKAEYCAQSALYAFNTAVTELVDRHGAVVEIAELPEAAAVWVQRDSFRAKPAAKSEAEPAKAAK